MEKIGVIDRPVAYSSQAVRGILSIAFALWLITLAALLIINWRLGLIIFGGGIIGSFIIAPISRKVFEFTLLIPLIKWAESKEKKDKTHSSLKEKSLPITKLSEQDPDEISGRNFNKALHELAKEKGLDWDDERLDRANRSAEDVLKKKESQALDDLALEKISDQNQLKALDRALKKKRGK